MQRGACSGRLFARNGRAGRARRRERRVRTALAVIVGYMTMFIVERGVLFAAFQILGVEMRRKHFTQARFRGRAAKFV